MLPFLLQEPSSEEAGQSRPSPLTLVSFQGQTHFALTFPGNMHCILTASVRSFYLGSLFCSDSTGKPLANPLQADVDTHSNRSERTIWGPGEAKIWGPTCRDADEQP